MIGKSKRTFVSEVVKSSDSGNKCEDKKNELAVVICTNYASYEYLS